MEFLKSIGRAVGEAANYLGEKNRRAAHLSRIRTVIRCQERAAEKEYLALGRYYYNNLRDKENPVTEPHCAALDNLEESLDRALSQLEKFYRNEREDREEVTLEDVEAFDQDPALGEAAAAETGEAPEAPAAPETAGEAVAPAAPEVDGNLPFEG